MQREGVGEWMGRGWMGGWVGGRWLGEVGEVGG